ncbi:hypothetical protein [Clostridium botulinum]|uniref:hypothetical protein n=1 Tax=Clostridium botulinum TaxID=1491 RepID=UPI001C9AB936|nr:hypothetical protein [Clostridium botulinum]MBY6898534.1 hypothetical protein [Clostridium botulinum]MBY6912838.1 hypothetical protein [Clostridium botulinum]MCR1178711.1 hypothetical protein [Clostridium botulinum]
MGKDIKIINLEGSEILKEQTGKEIAKEYKSVLPYSLLIAKLNRLHISFKDNKSKDIIGVNFNYGFDTEKLKKLDKEIRKQRQELKEYKKGVTIKKNKIKKSKDIEKEEKINEILKNAEDKINEYNTIIEELGEQYKQEKKEWNKDSIREKLYKNGFTLTYKNVVKGKEVEEKITYKFWFRTPAKSRVGDSLFINEKYYDDIVKWQDMGLSLPQGETKVVEFQAYRSLTASNIEDAIKINPKHILVVNDLDSYMDTNIISVEVNENGECVAESRQDKVKNTLWDGMCLLDSSYFKEGHNFYLLRQHMFKSCAFNTNIVQFLKDKYKEKYETATVEDRYGNNIRVEDIRLITTENSMKFEKFAECGAIGKDGKEIISKKKMFGYWKQRVKDDRYLFGICKHNHKSKYGNMQRMSYQMVNTLLIDKDQTEELAQYTVDHINNMKDSDNVFIEMLKETATEGNNNNLIVDLYNKNELFKDTQFYKTFKTETISNIKKRARQGKILVEGDNLTVCANPYMLLLHAVHDLDKYITDNVIENYEDKTLPISDNYISCYTERFDNEEELAGFRNPHNASNNIALFKNCKNELMQEYFNFGQNVIAVNLVNTELQDLANGLDEDSDFMLVTNNDISLKGAKKVFRNKDYACIVNNIPKDKKPWINSNESISKIDNLLAKSKNSIGVTSNLAQLALSFYQEEGTEELRNVVCIMSVLAQVAIDNAKRQYKIDIEKEIDRIKKLNCIKNYGNKYPNWFKYIKDIKAKNLLEKNKCKCTMQYLQQVIEDKVKNITNNKENLDTVELLENIIIDNKTNYSQIEKIEKLINNYDKKVKYTKKLANKYKWKEDKIEEEVRDTRDITISRIGSMKITKETMYYLVKEAIVENTEETDKQKLSDTKKCKRKMLNTLYNTHKELFLSVWK